MAYSFTSLPTVDKYDVNKYVLEPLFLGEEYMQYMDVMPNVSGTIKIDRFAAIGGITKVFATDEFTGETGDNSSSITITPVRMEAEVAFGGNSLYNKIKGQLMRAGHEFDNIDGTLVKQILMEMIAQGVKSDYNKQLWLSDSNGTDATGIFNVYDGLFDAAFAVTANKLNRGTLATEQASDAALAAGRGLDILKGLYEAASPELLEAGNHVYFVSGDVADDYMATNLEGTGYAAGGYGFLKDGGALTYRGIPIIVRRDWDVAIAANSGAINGCSNAAETHRAMLTTKDAFVVATDFDSNSVEQWYDHNHKQFRFRVAYSVGCALKDAKLACYYTPDNMA